MDKIKNNVKKTKDMLTTRLLLSNDIELLTKIIKTKTRLELNKTFFKKITFSTTIICRTFAILTHDMQINSVNTINN